MTIKTTTSGDKEIFTISIEGDFTFAMLQEFKKSYDNSDAASSKKIVIDLKHTNIIDSSALGMLLAMQKDLGKSGDTTVIINSNEVVLKILKITNFYKKFSIEE